MSVIDHLPFSVSVNKDQFTFWAEMSDIEREEELCEYLSDEFGFCVNSFFWGEHGNVIIMTEIDWDTSD